MFKCVVALYCCHLGQVSIVKLTLKVEINKYKQTAPANEGCDN